MKQNVVILLLAVCSYADEKKPGTCTKPPGTGLCVELCSSDEDCPGGQKCCSNGCGHTCQAPEGSEKKPGTCPKPRHFGVCVELCSSDEDCPGGQKCCSNGCGHTCQTPRGLAYAMLCSSNEDCPGGQKCCSNGCGHTCQTPRFLAFLFGQKEVCYNSDGIGCFSNASPYTNAFGNLPESPSHIQIQFLLYTRQNPNTVQQITQSSIQGSYFDGTKGTKFIIHGYQNYGQSPWVINMKNAFLQKEDANVISVNWEKGADNINYMETAANTRVVGALVAQMMEALHTNGHADYHDMHLIGHSLGAHIAGYAGERVPGTGRITGLDPAGPLFEKEDPKVRLDPSDALFVDAIHTDVGNLLELGLGMERPVGHADFYPNGGEKQPGCPNVGNHLFSLITMKITTLVDGVVCSHMRVLDLFTESITSTCPFQAMPCPDKTQFAQGKCTSCGRGCAKMGYHANEGNPRGTFYLATNSKAPFCRQ